MICRIYEWSMLATYLPELQVTAGELVGPFAHCTPPFTHENTARVGRVCDQHPDSHPRAFNGFI